MDTSKEYIKMVDCPEIQEQKEEFKNGDWFAYYDSMAHGKRGELYTYAVGATFYDFTRAEVRKWHRLSIVGWDEGDCELAWKDKIIYLPRQDQIQEMLPKNNCKCPCCLIFCLNKFIEENLDGLADENIDSIEQYWLAFYMLEKHKKIWKGEKWIKLSK